VEVKQGALNFFFVHIRHFLSSCRYNVCVGGPLGIAFCFPRPAPL
jgi:hypothetical protein